MQPYEFEFTLLGQENNIVNLQGKYMLQVTELGGSIDFGDGALEFHAGAKADCLDLQQTIGGKFYQSFEQNGPVKLVSTSVAVAPNFKVVITKI